MKKLLLIMLLTFTTFANADERYLIVHDATGGGIWIFDTKKVEVKYCDSPIISMRDGVSCTKWKSLDDNED